MPKPGSGPLPTPAKRELPPRRAGRAAPRELLACRGAALGAPKAYELNDEVDLTERSIGGVRALLLAPKDAVGTLVYFHGGGFRSGSPERWAPFASRLAQRSGCHVVLPDYGLAPECPFPGALLDGDAILREFSGDDLVIGGDSAGGNLATGLARLHAGALGPSLRGLLLFSPWLDLTVSASSYATKAESDGLFSQSAALDAADLYLQGHSAEDPLASPLFADLGGLPATLVVVSCAEVLLDDSLACANKLAVANVEIALHAIPDMAHAAAALSSHLGGARQGFDLAVRFLRRRFRENLVGGS